MICATLACLIAASTEPTWPPPPEPRTAIVIVPLPAGEPRPEDICAPGVKVKLHFKSGRKPWVSCDDR